MLLTDRTAVIYGGGGAIGGAVARAYAKEGAHVFLAGRTPEPLERVASDIDSDGGRVETAVVDALDEGAVDAHAEDVVARTGSIDISFNLISHGAVRVTPLAEMPLADFEQPVVTALRTNFLTARAAARQMIRQRSGVLLFLGGYGHPLPGSGSGGLRAGFPVGPPVGLQAGLQALDTLRGQLAGELGVHGIRALTLRTAGVPEPIPPGVEAVRRTVTGERTGGRAMLRPAASLADVADVAVFAASDHARSLTGTSLTITCGARRA